MAVTVAVEPQPTIPPPLVEPPAEGMELALMETVQIAHAGVETYAGLLGDELLPALSVALTA
jgi:hypothetical protein